MSKAKKALKGIGITLTVLLIALTVLRIMLPGIIVNQTVLERLRKEDEILLIEMEKRYFGKLSFTRRL